MKVYGNYPEPTLSRGLAKLLVDSLDAKGEVWLISPWLKDVRLAIAQLGDFASLLGGQREEIELSQLLTRIAEQHRLRVITKPPGELIPFRALKRLAYKIDLRKRLLEEREEQEDLQGYDILEEVIEEFNTEIEQLASAATVHAETIRIGRMLKAKGAELYYLDKLHAKLLCTPLGALIGSANFTNGGLSYNDELMLEITDQTELAKLRTVAQQMVNRAILAQKYNLNNTLEREEYPLKDYLALTDSQELQNFPHLQHFLKQVNTELAAKD
ncbi:MAG: phospholipase D-like domain-containing protein [Coleofasciculus sp. D1-CHI-01]|uniref:phospholipase D-like domain-containing protein n=1 Tax=Coleofasciculus sp. D1-CHI-01 TaxID=3068482 RepID=UPI0032F1BE6B